MRKPGLVVASITLACSMSLCSCRSPDGGSALDERESRSATVPELVSLSTAEPPAPPVVLEPLGPSDLGRFPWGTVVPFQVALVNVSEEPVTIANVRTNCDCTVVRDDYIGTVVASGDSVLLDATVDLRDYVGEKTRRVTVVLKSGFQVATRVRVTSVPTYQVSAGLVDFGDIDMLDDIAEERHEIVTFSSETVELSGPVVTDCDWLAATATQRSESMDILLTVLREQLGVGPSHGTVTIPTTDGVRPEFVVRVIVRGVMRIMPYPSDVFLFGDTPQTISFRDANAEQVSVKRILMEPEDALRIVHVDRGQLKIWNPTGASQDRVSILVEDESGRRGRVIVHVFEGEGRQ